jgi:hypothetical protein
VKCMSWNNKEEIITTCTVQQWRLLASCWHQVEGSSWSEGKNCAHTTRRFSIHFKRSQSVMLRMFYLQNKCFWKGHNAARSCCSEPGIDQGMLTATSRQSSHCRTHRAAFDTDLLLSLLGRVRRYAPTTPLWDLKSVWPQVSRTSSQ